MSRALLELEGFVLCLWDLRWVGCLGYRVVPGGWEREFMRVTDEVIKDHGFASYFREHLKDVRDDLRRQGAVLVPRRERGQTHAWSPESGRSPSEQYLDRVCLTSRPSDPWAFLHVSEPMEARGASDEAINAALKTWAKRQLGYPHADPCPCALKDGCDPCLTCGRCECERQCMCELEGSAFPLPGPCWR